MSRPPHAHAGESCECVDPEHAVPCHRKRRKGRSICSWCSVVHAGAGL